MSANPTRLLTIALLAVTVVASHAQSNTANTEIVLASGLDFPEGPSPADDGRALYSVNVHGNMITRIDLKTKAVEKAWVTLPEGGRGNGSTIGPDKALYIADVGRKSIERIDPNTKTVTTVVDKTDAGEGLRGPNDLIFDSHGGLYFTDPEGTWNDPVGIVYYVKPGEQTATPVAGSMQYPNGLALSWDEKTLYVDECARGQIDAVGLSAPGKTNGPTRAWVHTGGSPDGMRLGRDGCLYVAINSQGVIDKIGPDGTVKARVPVAAGKAVTNLCFSRDGKSIYVTEADSNSLVAVRL